MPESAVRPGEDPRQRARMLSKVRDVVLSGGAPVVAPRSVIEQSWRRMRQTGIDPGAHVEIPLLDPGELRRRRAESGLEPLLPILRDRLLPAAEAAGQIMVVVDAEGRVLWREGGTAVRRRADTLGFVEGSAWDEASVGTNAIGTALVVDSPVHVFAGEHWAEGHQPWTCAAAPLHDPITGQRLGAVDLSGPAHTVHASTVALVDAVSRLVELELRVKHEEKAERLRAVAAPLLAALDGPALVLTPEGVCVAASRLPLPGRVDLPRNGIPEHLVLPALGEFVAEPLPGGWLLRPTTTPSEPAESVLDLTATPPRLTVRTAAGQWSHDLTPRHAQILEVLVRHPEGRTASELAHDVFGENGRAVTVRAELARMRKVLGPLLAQQPYRVTGTVRVTARTA